MALPTLAAPALLGLETPENLCPYDLLPNGPHQHVPHLPQQRAEETQTWASELPFPECLEPMPGSQLRPVVQSIWSKSP